MVKEVTSRDMLMLERIKNMLCRYRAYIEAYYLLVSGIGLNGKVNGENGGNISTEK